MTFLNDASDDRAPEHTTVFPVYGNALGASPLHGAAGAQGNASYHSSLPHGLSFFHWKAFFLFLGLACLAVALWSSTSDIFEVPPEVAKAHITYQNAKQRYFQNPAYWDSKREHLERELCDDCTLNDGQNVPHLLETLSQEMVISYLFQVLQLSKERLETVCMVPKESASTFTIIISKFEQAIWPLKIVLSLEAEVSIQKNGIGLLFTRLRQGSEDMATGLAWAYFGSDLELLKPLPIISMKASQSSRR